MEIELEHLQPMYISATTIQALFTRIMMQPLVYVLSLGYGPNQLFMNIPSFMQITRSTLSPVPILSGMAFVCFEYN